MANHMTAEQLLPCPFCGSAAIERWHCAGDDGYFEVCCARTECTTFRHGDDEDRVRADWNTRAARLSGMAAGWQPIETAPKDGKDYIASDGRLRTLENQPQGCMPGRWSKGPDGKWSGYANRPIGYAPKYWHPLPAAPEPPHV